MSDTDRIYQLNQMLAELDRRSIPAWECGIVAVARQAILEELATVARSVARWQREFHVPPVIRIAAQSEFG